MRRPVCCVLIVVVCAWSTFCKACYFNIVHVLYTGSPVLCRTKSERYGCIVQVLNKLIYKNGPRYSGGKIVVG